MCLTPQVYLFIRQLYKSPPVGSSRFFAANDNVATTVTTAPTRLVHRIHPRHHVTPALHPGVTKAPLTAVYNEDESHADADGEGTSKTAAMDTAPNVDQDSTRPTDPLQTTVGTTLGLACCARSVQPTLRTAQNSAWATQSLQPTVGTVKDWTCPVKSFQPAVCTIQGSPCSAKTLQQTVKIIQDSKSPAKSIQPTVGTLQDLSRRTKSLEPTVDTPPNSTCPAKTFLPVVQESASRTTDTDKRAQCWLSQTAVEGKVAQPAAIAIVTTTPLSEVDEEYESCADSAQKLAISAEESAVDAVQYLTGYTTGISREETAQCSRFQRQSEKIQPAHESINRRASSLLYTASRGLL